jgi:hypothetical protein
VCCMSKTWQGSAASMTLLWRTWATGRRRTRIEHASAKGVTRTIFTVKLFRKWNSAEPAENNSSRCSLSSFPLEIAFIIAQLN